jgi:secreted trypsin-like serine protease
MRKLGIVVALSALGVLAVAPITAAQDQTTQVVGGSVDRQPDVQWIAALTYRGRFVCGGSLVTRRYVLTAAHCVEGSRFDPWRVRLGSKNRSYGGSVLRINGGSLYPDYDFPYGDMALMRLERRVGYTPVRLAPKGTPQSVGFSAYLAGWGSTWGNGPRSHGPPSGVLRSAFIPTRRDAACSRTYGRRYHGAVMLCAGDGHPDACFGDSGGPLARRVNGTWQLLGVTSQGHPRGCGVGPGAYAWVGSAQLRSWLRNRLGI